MKKTNAKYARNKTNKLGNDTGAVKCELQKEKRVQINRVELYFPVSLFTPHISANFTFISPLDSLNGFDRVRKMLFVQIVL